MQQSDRNALVLRIPKGNSETLNFGGVKPQQNLPPSVHPFANSEAAIAGQQGLGQDKIQIILLKAAFGAHLDHIPEALGRDQRRLCAPPFYQRIGGQRRAMDHLRYRRGRNACLRTNPVHRFDNGLFGRGIGGQNLGGMARAVNLQHHIGEGAANIHSHPGDFPCHSISPAMHFFTLTDCAAG